MVLFETNLLSKIIFKAPKKHHIQHPVCTFKVQIRCKLNAHFGWVNRAFIQNRTGSLVLPSIFVPYSINVSCYYIIKAKIHVIFLTQIWFGECI